MSSSESAVHYHFHVSVQAGPITINIGNENGKKMVHIEPKKEKPVIEPLDIPPGSFPKNDYPLSSSTFPKNEFGNYSTPVIASSANKKESNTPHKFKLEPLKPLDHFESPKIAKKVNDDEFVGTDCMGFSVFGKNKMCNTNISKKRPNPDDLSFLSPHDKKMMTRSSKQRGAFDFGV